MSRVTVGCDANRCFPLFSQPARSGVNPSFFGPKTGLSGQFTHAPAAADAGYNHSANVQISHFVTKVLIPKRFCRSLSKRQLTNLET
jgi:hypothetical protein